MKEKTDDKVKSLLVNDDFINYVFNPSLALEIKWIDFFSMHPDQLPYAIQAKQILLGEDGLIVLPEHETEEIKLQILEMCRLSDSR